MKPKSLDEYLKKDRPTFEVDLPDAEIWEV